MDDVDVIKSIDELVDQEHKLRERHRTGDGLSPEDREQLEQIEVKLDQCWDLLRRRRAARNSGEDPDATPLRDADIVERYQQ